MSKSSELGQGYNIVYATHMVSKMESAREKAMTSSAAAAHRDMSKMMQIEVCRTSERNLANGHT